MYLLCDALERVRSENTRTEFDCLDFCSRGGIIGQSGNPANDRLSCVTDMYDGVTVAMFPLGGAAQWTR